MENLFKTKFNRNPGGFSITNNKLRIENSNGQTSVLFEDISSITWQTRKLPNQILISVGAVMLFLGPIYAATIGSSNNISDSSLNNWVLFIVIIAIGLIIYGMTKKNIWDDVIVETRGGMLVSYSVDNGKGEIEVNKIEDAKRSLPTF